MSRSKIYALLQQRALTKAQLIAANIKAEYSKYPHGKWLTFNRIRVVVDAAPSKGFGLGFRRVTPKAGQHLKSFTDPGGRGGDAGKWAPNKIKDSPWLGGANNLAKDNRSKKWDPYDYSTAPVPTWEQK